MRVTTSDGLLVTPRALFLDHDVKIPDKGELRGLPLGPLRLYVLAEGYRTAVIDTVVTKEPQTIEVTLPAK